MLWTSSISTLRSLPGQVAVVSDDHGPVLLVRVRDVRQLAAVPGLSPAL